MIIISVVHSKYVLDAVGSPAYRASSVLVWLVFCDLVQKMAGKQVRRENREFSELYRGVEQLGTSIFEEMKVIFSLPILAGMFVYKTL